MKLTAGFREPGRAPLSDTPAFLAYKAQAGAWSGLNLRPGGQPTTFNGSFRMSKIIRTEPGAILSKAVEYHGFVYLPGITAKDTSKDIKGQTADVLAQIDAMLEHHGTDKTRLLQALIWVKHIKDRTQMNEVWTPWLPKEGAPVRACVQSEMAAPEVLVEIMVTACK